MTLSLKEKMKMARRSKTGVGILTSAIMEKGNKSESPLSLRERLEKAKMEASAKQHARKSHGNNQSRVRAAASKAGMDARSDSLAAKKIERSERGMKSGGGGKIDSTVVLKER